MRKGFYLLLLFVLPALAATAATGDTTWVQAHSDIWLPSTPKNIDTVVEFPDGSKTYRKVFMTFTLGKYQCPGNPEYCGDWDYTVQNFLLTPNGDTVELGRLITPYANAGGPRTPWGWKQRYTFDVTDFYPLLKDSATVRIHYSGYSGGFTANVQFAFIEGTPPRNVLAIERLWHGAPRFGDPSDPIESKVATINKTAPANTKYSEFKFNITGHNSDDNYCSEFCKKHYNVMLNGNSIEQKDIWRADCGYNHIYPQTGTWIYDRGNWCPGDLIHSNVHKLPGITAGSNYDIDVDFESYTGSASLQGRSWGSYIIDGGVFYYGDYNRQNDASLEDIVAPNNHEMYFRQNPYAGNPVIKVKNTGANNLTSLKISYETGGKTNEYFWQGTIAPLEDALITLPEIPGTRTLTGDNTFTAKILEANGQADEDNTNNSLTSTYTMAPVYAMRVVVRLFTNKSSVGGVSETNWYLIEGGKDTIARRVNNAISTVYEDTITLGPSFYHLVVEDKGCDGLSWSANQAAGSGTVSIKAADAIIPYSLKGYFTGNFGCGFTQAFYVNWPTTVDNVSREITGLDVYPNPAGNSVSVAINGNIAAKGSISIVDALGRVVLNQPVSGNITTLNTNTLANGMYTIKFASEQAGATNHYARLVIAK